MAKPTVPAPCLAQRATADPEGDEFAMRGPGQGRFEFGIIFVVHDDTPEQGFWVFPGNAAGASVPIYLSIQPGVYSL